MFPIWACRDVTVAVDLGPGEAVAGTAADRQHEPCAGGRWPAMPSVQPGSRLGAAVGSCGFGNECPVNEREEV